MSKNPPSLQERQKQWNAEYLDSVATIGGSVKGYREHVREHYADEMRIYTEQMFDAALARGWRAAGQDAYVDSDGNQMTLFGDGLQASMTICGKPNNYDEKNAKRVATAHALVRHVGEDANFAAHKATQAQQAADRKRDQFEEALRRANGDDGALLVTVLDD